MAKHVAASDGGMSAEREVSLALGQGLRRGAGAAWLPRLVNRRRTPETAAALAAAKPDVALTCSRPPRRRRTLQGLLEAPTSPYSHSGVRLRPGHAEKRRETLFEAAGVPVARTASAALRGGRGARLCRPPTWSSRSRRAERRRAPPSTEQAPAPAEELGRDDGRSARRSWSSVTSPASSRPAWCW